MNSILVTIIVPIYKAEQYLDECINSLVRQTYQNVEIILVDDGSPDRCPELCDRWAQFDQRVRVIHKVNGGVSRARNSGLEVAKGTLISFVDSDDFLPENAISSLVEQQQKHDADLACGSFRALKTGGRVFDKVYEDRYILDQDFKDNVSLLVDKLHTSPWGKLFKMQIIRENSLIFPEDMPSGEDTTFCYRYLACTRSICFTKERVYYYRMTSPAAATKKYYENMNELIGYQFEAQKQFLMFAENPHGQLVKEQEHVHFERCLAHYVIHERNRNKLLQKIEESADIFPGSKSHSIYGSDVEKRQWGKVAQKWKRNNVAWYLIEQVRYILKFVR